DVSCHEEWAASQEQSCQRYQGFASHFPELVFPIDREYTQTFFGWRNPEFQNNPRDCFMVSFLAFCGMPLPRALGKYLARRKPVNSAPAVGMTSLRQGASPAGYMRTPRFSVT